MDITQRLLDRIRKSSVADAVTTDRSDGSLDHAGYINNVKRSINSGNIRASLHGRQLSADEVFEAVNQIPELTRNLSMNAAAVMRWVVLTAGPEENVDLGVLVKNVLWAEKHQRLWRPSQWPEAGQPDIANYEGCSAMYARVARASLDQGLSVEEGAELLQVYEASRQDDGSAAMLGRGDTNPVAERFFRVLGESGREETFRAWSLRWLDSAFTRLSVSHKLAAGLCFTTALAEEELKAPWKAWSIALPDGLFVHEEHEWKRIWVEGTKPFYIMAESTENQPPEGARDLMNTTYTPRRIVSGVPVEHLPEAFQEAVRNLVSGLVVLVTNGEAKKTGAWGIKRERPNRKPIRHDFGETWVAAKPIEIDLRDELRSVISGTRQGGGGLKKALWVVRGHWKNQVHGVGRALRRRQWIEPYWKGDDGLKTLVRTVKVE